MDLCIDRLWWVFRYVHIFALLSKEIYESISNLHGLQNAHPFNKQNYSISLLMIFSFIFYIHRLTQIIFYTWFFSVPCVANSADPCLIYDYLVLINVYSRPWVVEGHGNNRHQLVLFRLNPCPWIMPKRLHVIPTGSCVCCQAVILSLALLIYTVLQSVPWLPCFKTVAVWMYTARFS